MWRTASRGVEVIGLDSIIRPLCPTLATPPTPPVNFFIENWFLFVAALISGAALAYPAIVGASRGAQLSPAQAVQLINRERAVLVDVSDPAEYATGHAGGAKNVPFATLETTKDLPRNKALPIVLMCPSGARAARAVAILKKLGYEKANSVAGGLKAWSAASLPVERQA
jgi:rhodanese-related sulfurtransferase